MYEHYSTHEFEASYTYTGSDLGVRWTPGKTTFRLWAPTAPPHNESEHNRWP